MRKLFLWLLLSLAAFPAYADPLDINVGNPERFSRPGGVIYPTDTPLGCSMSIGQFSMPYPAAGGNSRCNIAIGYQAMGGVMTNAAQNDICIGTQSCRRLTSGANDLVIGYQAGGFTTGSNNIAIGTITSQNLSTPSDYIHVDPESSVSASPGGTGRNVVFGTHQGYSQTGGTIMGMDTAYSDINSGAGYNSIFGTNTARTNFGSNATSPTASIMFGAAGNTINTYSDVPLNSSPGTVIGFGLNKPGQFDTAIGWSALNASTQDGNKNAAFGYSSLNADTTGVDNAAFGYQTCLLVAAGSNNVCLGYNVGSTTLTSGGSNILIGTSSAVTTAASGTSSELNIGGLVFDHLAGTAVPVLSACGTTPTVDSRANNASGTVTVGSGTVGSCTVTFASAYTTWNHCKVTSHTGGVAALAYSYTTSAITITATSLTSDVFDYVCDGY